MKKIYEYVGKNVDCGTDFTYEETPKYLGELEVGCKFKALYCDISDGGMLLFSSFEKNLDDEKVVEELVNRCYKDECDNSNDGDAGDITYYIIELEVYEDHIEGGDVLWERMINWIDRVLDGDKFYLDGREVTEEEYWSYYRSLPSRIKEECFDDSDIESGES